MTSTYDSTESHTVKWLRHECNEKYGDAQK
jgi:hypothetical protein